MRDRAVFWVAAATFAAGAAVLPFVAGFMHLPDNAVTVSDYVNSIGFDWLAIWGLVSLAMYWWAITLNLAHGHLESHHRGERAPSGILGPDGKPIQPPSRIEIRRTPRGGETIVGEGSAADQIAAQTRFVGSTDDPRPIQSGGTPVPRSETFEDPHHPSAGAD